ncbi:MAG: heavy-metal-associated domain-containing protein [Micrococcales bacterium]|nr:heavy-metal-associated domain-containing protein [Micrococcales bacterium]
MDNNTDTNRAAGPALVTLQVEGMSCTGCEHRIGNTLRRVEGVRGAAADHTTGRVLVRVRPGVEPEALAAKIAAAGYTVTDTETRTDTGTGEDPR